jgi:predicted acyl esterase
MRQVNKKNVKHSGWLPYRNYISEATLPVRQGEIYPVDVEIWPTNVVAEKGGKIMLEIASGDTQGAGLFLHNDLEDRYSTLRGSCCS